MAASLLLASVLGCQSPEPLPGQGFPGTLGAQLGPSGPQLESLAASVEPLREAFNARLGQPRVLVLLSATEGPCALGARAVRESVLESYPDADLWVGIVWVDMQASDCARSAELAARRFVDQRVEHFHDPGRRAGRTFAVGLLPTGVAWDVYLFYDRGAEWVEEPPRPFTWSHQLGRIEPDHFHPREMLFEALHSSTGELLRARPSELAVEPTPSQPPPSTRWAGLERPRD